ncbi:acetyl-CoA carboxylase [Saccharopolyspora hirsuta]|uniref:Biotin carboxyl carrier protein of acetyl-CoA carboxylase n=1 Tax=Saccharopolyspora hirsuta TaxID=1837 RepID=A0A5M7BYE7_SACHI|nr:acetyl-CoA carboxylase [Saccharopolyspora hirsuta]KAA5835256.1 biotin carboxyl carrier domain-containing protein [Saccharopolyspora hirsuta]
MSTIHQVTSPIPGTFYAKESPSEPPFITVGAKVSAGDTIGLVEVMKMFNRVTAEVSGTVVEICVENEDPVDAGDVLIRLEEF